MASTLPVAVEALLHSAAALKTNLGHVAVGFLLPLNAALSLLTTYWLADELYDFAVTQLPAGLLPGREPVHCCGMGIKFVGTTWVAFVVATMHPILVAFGATRLGRQTLRGAVVTQSVLLGFFPVMFFVGTGLLRFH